MTTEMTMPPPQYASITCTDDLLQSLTEEMVYIDRGELELMKEQVLQVPSFYLGRYPVTNAQLVPFLNDIGNREEEGISWINIEGSFAGVGCGIAPTLTGFESVDGLAHHPAVYVSWNGARAFCRWLSEQTGKDYRLPSEAEWAYAAGLARSAGNYPYAGSASLKEVGWYEGNSFRETKPVGLKLANERGLYDMSGSVWEWCEDDWRDDLAHAPLDGRAWVDEPRGTSRVIRGGGWSFNARICRVAHRHTLDPTFRFILVGFRLALSF